MRFFHGSSEELPTNLILEGRGNDYEKDWKNTDFYDVLEKYRPEGFIAHKNAVFLCHHPDDIDCVGGNTDYISEMKVCGNIQRHDMNWASQISCLVSEGHIDSEDIKKCAENYWTGIPYSSNNVWEYLTEKAQVLSCSPFEIAFIEEFIPENISTSTFNQFKESINFENLKKNKINKKI